MPQRFGISWPTGWGPQCSAFSFQAQSTASSYSAPLVAPYQAMALAFSSGFRRPRDRSSPLGSADSVPARAAYSHSASVGRR